MKQKLSNTTNRSKALFIGIAAIVLVAAGYIAYAKVTNSLWPFNTAKTTVQDSPERPVNDVDYSPPTEEDASHANDAKKRLDESTKQEQTKTNIYVGVTMADIAVDQLEIRSFVSGVIEGGGTCTATLTRNGISVAATSTAFVDSTTSICTPISIPLTRFKDSGQWDLVVSYSSVTSTGTSTIIKVELP